MTRYEVLKLAHILAAMAWVGGVIVTRVIAGRMKTAEPAHRLGFSRDQAALVSRVFTPAAAVVLGTGVWMVADTPALGFEQLWILIGFAAVVVPMGVAHGFARPTADKAIDLMEAGRGPEAAALMARLAPVIRAVLALLLVAVWAMVAKPGL